MRLFLIRHGQTDYNIQQRYCGISDVSLNQTGRQQAREVSRRWDPASVSVIYCSPLRRAQETADYVFGARPRLPAPEIAEINFGIWEGLTAEQILVRDASTYERWLRDPCRYAPAGGETLVAVAQRVQRFIGGLAAQHRGQAVGCVTHAGVIRIVSCLAAGRPLTGFWDITVESASVHSFTIAEWPAWEEWIGGE